MQEKRAYHVSIALLVIGAIGLPMMAIQAYASVVAVDLQKQGFAAHVAALAWGLGALVALAALGYGLWRLTPRTIVWLRARWLRRITRLLAWLPGSRGCRVRLNKPPWREIWWPDAGRTGVFNWVEMIVMLIPSPERPDAPIFGGVEISTDTDGRIVFYVGSDGRVRVFETSIDPLTFAMETPVRKWHTLRLLKDDNTYSAYVNGALITQRPLQAPHHTTQEITDLWPEKATVKARANTESPTSQVALLAFDVDSR